MEVKENVLLLHNAKIEINYLNISTSGIEISLYIFPALHKTSLTKKVKKYIFDKLKWVCLKTEA